MIMEKIKKKMTPTKVEPTTFRSSQARLITRPMKHESRASKKGDVEKRKKTRPNSDFRDSEYREPFVFSWYFAGLLVMLWHISGKKFEAGPHLLGVGPPKKLKLVNFNLAPNCTRCTKNYKYGLVRCIYVGTTCFWL